MRLLYKCSLIISVKIRKGVDLEERKLKILLNLCFL